MYSPGGKKIRSHGRPDQQRTKSSEKRKIQNPFKVSGRMPSPKKKVISRLTFPFHGIRELFRSVQVWTSLTFFHFLSTRFFKPLSPTVGPEPFAPSDEGTAVKKLCSEEDLKLGGTDSMEDSCTLITSRVRNFSTNSFNGNSPTALESTPCSQMPFKFLEMSSSSKSSSLSSQENYEPLPDAPLKVCSIDSMCLSQDADASADELTTAPDVIFVEHSSRSPKKSNKKKLGMDI